MGLDVFAYSNLVQGTEGGRASIYVNQPHARHRHSIEPGDYSYDEEFHFRAGSYGTYNRWRDQLGRFVGIADLAEWWKAPTLKGGFELILNFSDCEGVRDAGQCRILADAFRREARRAESFFDPIDLKVYGKFLKAFEFGAQSGCVVFG